MYLEIFWLKYLLQRILFSHSVRLGCFQSVTNSFYNITKYKDLLLQECIIGDTSIHPNIHSQLWYSGIAQWLESLHGSRSGVQVLVMLSSHCGYKHLTQILAPTALQVRKTWRSYNWGKQYEVEDLKNVHVCHGMKPYFSSYTQTCAYPCEYLTFI